MKRFLCLGAVLCLLLGWVGCGQVFRPIIIPNPPQFPNPAAAHTVVTLNDNGTFNDGSAMVIDVSGDSVVSIKSVGLNPVHAVMQSATQALVVNQSNASLPQDSVTKLFFSGTTIGGTTTITLPPSYDASGNLTTGAPNFVATTEANQAYVLMPQYQPPNQNNVGGTIVPSFAVINTTLGSTVTTIPVGNSPVAMVETPDGAKLYVANQGDGTLNAFNTRPSISTRTINGSPTAPPIWLSARTDSQQVYVLEGNGTLGYLNTSLTAGPDTFAETGISAPGAAYMWYDMILNRLYIPGETLVSTGSGPELVPAVTIVDVSQSVPQDQVFPGGAIQILTVPPGDRSGSDPCSSTTQPPANPLLVVAATSLPDGSRAYIGSYYDDGTGNVCPQVTVIDTTNNSIKTATAIPGFPDATISSSPYYAPACTKTRDLVGPTGSGFRFSMAVAGDSSRAYLASCDGGNVSIIYTSNDSYAANALAPSSARSPIPPSNQPPPQNPVFVFAGP